jgi:hypothetical protein
MQLYAKHGMFKRRPPAVSTDCCSCMWLCAVQAPPSSPAGNGLIKGHVHSPRYVSLHSKQQAAEGLWKYLRVPLHGYAVQSNILQQGQRQLKAAASTCTVRIAALRYYAAAAAGCWLSCVVPPGRNPLGVGYQPQVCHAAA